LLISCASNQDKNIERKAYFVTNIKDDGSKVFSYSLISNMSNKEKGRRKEGERRDNGKMRKSKGERQGKSSGKLDNANIITRIEKTFYQGLNEKLNTTHFCRQGYFTIDKFISRKKSQLKGECNESATKLDREKLQGL